MRLLATYQFYFLVLRIEVSQELVLVSNQMREGGREGGDLRGVRIMLDFN
jgi:hypothetical protein